MVPPAVLAAMALAGAGDFAATEWAAFKTKFGKAYATADEEAARFKVFMGNMAEIATRNKAAGSAKFGVTRLSDRTPAEFAAMRGLKVGAQGRRGARFTANGDVQAVPTKVDWRDQGAVTPIKDQQQCGSCWAFSTTGGLEGQWNLAGHTLTALSEQFLVSCDTKDDGCNGGLMANAIQFLVQDNAGKIPTEASVPYQSSTGMGYPPACSALPAGTNGAIAAGYKMVDATQAAFQQFVSQYGPLSIAVDASNWQFYTGGVFSNCGTNLDHGVLLVGYDSAPADGSAAYWIVKNSWNTDWGEKGYIRLAMTGGNTCGMFNAGTWTQVQGRTA